MYPNRQYLQSKDGPRLVDTHCHLDLEPLVSCLPEVLDSARRAGVGCFMVPGVHPRGWDRIVSIGRGQEEIFAALGIHPMHADEADDAALSRLAEMAPAAVAIGEIGLDPAYPIPPGVQEQAFREQLRIASSLGLPVLVHCRRAFQRTLQILREESAGRTGGIMHAFSGSPEMAREFVRLGFLISISGTVTWTNAVRPIRLARELPLECLVLETDAPDMTPQAFRGRPNQPAYLAEVLAGVARIRGISPEDVAKATTHNFSRVFSRP